MTLRDRPPERGRSSRPSPTNHREIRMHKLLFLSLCLVATLARADIIADWEFDGPAGQTLNQAANTGSQPFGPGTAWNVAITGLATDGNGALRLANDGKGGSGTRSAYADFGPDFDSIASGRLSLFARLGAWQLPAEGELGFSLGFIEGSSFGTAGWRLSADAGGFRLAGTVDPWGDGSAVAPGLLAGGWTTLTLRLDLRLDTRAYQLGYDTGAGLQWLGGGQADSLTAGVNSLLLGVDGDFGAAPLLLDRVWVGLNEPLPAVPEPAALLLMLAGLAALRLRGTRR